MDDRREHEDWSAGDGPLAAAGQIHAWHGVALLPLYHAGLLGRISRDEAAQRADMRALRRHLGRD
jgi:hypothetical protein